MMRFLLERLERNPRATFSQGELSRYGPEFNDRVRSRLLRAMPADSTLTRDGEELTVIVGDDGPEAINLNDPDSDPIALNADDLRWWAVDLERFTAELRTQRGYAGNHGALTERVWLLGSADTRSVVLALLTPTTGPNELRAVRSLIPASMPQAVDVLCPSYSPPIELRRELEGARVFCSLLNESTAEQEPATTSPPAVLEHNADYSAVTLGELHIPLRPPQAAVVRVLAESAASGFPCVPTARLLAAAAAAGSHATRLGDIFRRRPEWKRLVVRCDRGSYRLAAARMTESST